MQQFPQVVNRKRNAGHKMRLFFKISTKAISPKHLQCAEKNEQPQPLPEMSLIHVYKAFQGTKIGTDHFLLQFFWIARTSLPYERSYIIIKRTTSSSLEIYEIRLTILNHHIPCLEIPVHKSISDILKQIILQFFEIYLKRHFVEFKSGKIKKAIFEIVKIKHHHSFIRSEEHTSGTPVTSSPRMRCAPCA